MLGAGRLRAYPEGERGHTPHGVICTTPGYDPVQPGSDPLSGPEGYDLRFTVAPELALDEIQASQTGAERTVVESVVRCQGSAVGCAPLVHGRVYTPIGLEHVRARETKRVFRRAKLLPVGSVDPRRHRTNRRLARRAAGRRGRNTTQHNDAEQNRNTGVVHTLTQ